jgi:hypothetical protein
MYGVYIQFWPTLFVANNLSGVGQIVGLARTVYIYIYARTFGDFPAKEFCTYTVYTQSGIGLHEASV